MSHEIRTPLNAIFGYTQLLARNVTLDCTQSHALEQITQAGDHLLGLINELLDIAKIESGRVELMPEPIDLETCIGHVVGIARLRAQQAGLTFTFEPPATWPPRLLLDERKLRQVVLNLLNNAVQFTPQGNIHLALTVAPVAASGYRMVFIVRDTGIGLEHETQQRIFEPFYRTGRSEERRVGIECRL